MSVPFADYDDFALVAGTATAPVRMVNGTAGYTIENDDAAALFVGFDAMVSNNHYWAKIPPGGVRNVTMTSLGTSGSTKLWFYSLAGNASKVFHWGATL